MIVGRMRNDGKSKRAVVLLSGGMDSSTALAFAAHEGFTCYALTFRYGQRHVREIYAAKQVADSLGIELE